MHLGAHVLLPEGFEQHPDARYPLVIFHGHFPDTFRGFREEPPDPDLEPEFSDRFQIEGYNRIVQQQAHQFYKEWTGPDFPRVLLVEIQHANPYYDDSYAVNSANVGPYGDAITYELIPEIEKRFRGIGAGWSRFVYGGSTGGWEALAVQVFYPDEYNGCFAACPDPIDFRAYTVVNLYEDDNAYFANGPLRPRRPPRAIEIIWGTSTPRWRARITTSWCWARKAAPANSGTFGKPSIRPSAATVIRSRSGTSARARSITKWPSIGASTTTCRTSCDAIGRRWVRKLRGKIHIYCGDMDNYYLNNAVYLTEDFLRQADPPFEGEIDYGDRDEHCWNGDHERPNAISRLRYHQMYLPKIVERILKTAPADGDMTSWRY